MTIDEKAFSKANDSFTRFPSTMEELRSLFEAYEAAKQKAEASDQPDDCRYTEHDKQNDIERDRFKNIQAGIKGEKL